MTTNLKIFDVPDKNDMKEKLTFSEFLVYLRSMDKSPEKIKKMIINDSEIEKELLELVQKCEKQIFLNFKLEEKDIVFDLFEEQDNSEEKHEEIKMEQNETLKNREENLLGENMELNEKIRQAPENDEPNTHINDLETENSLEMTKVSLTKSSLNIDKEFEIYCYKKIEENEIDTNRK